MSEIFERHKNKFTRMWSIDINHWRNNLDYFGEALAIREEFDLIKIMTVNCDFDVQLIHQFYATVHFGSNEERHLSFMCRDEFFHVPGELSAMLLAMRIPGWRVKVASVLMTELTPWTR